MFIKICGLRREQDIAYVNELQPDYAGFILSPGFRRSIDKKTAKHLRQRLSPHMQAVGVFVDESADIVNSFVADGIIDIVQLHGGESPAYCKAINAPVIKCFKCGRDSDIQGEIEQYDTAYFMFDSGAGSGQAFDWGNIPKTEKNFFLAGGLGEHNLRAAMEKIKPFAVDISSGAETDGFKDYNKIKRIMEIVRHE